MITNKNHRNCFLSHSYKCNLDFTFSFHQYRCYYKSELITESVQFFVSQLETPKISNLISSVHKCAGVNLTPHFS
jgi:hypothetical protein